MEAIRVAAIGDSVIYGRHDPNGGWIGRIRRFVEAADAAAGVFNLGIGGQNSKQILERITEITVRTPNIVIVGCGLNDMRSESRQGEAEVPIDIFRRNLEKIIDFSAASGTRRVLVTTMNPIDFAEDAFQGLWYPFDRWTEYNQTLREVANSAKAEIIEFSDFPDFTLSTGMLGDKIHPSPKGHEVMAERALSQIV